MAAKLVNECSDETLFDCKRDKTAFGMTLAEFMEYFNNGQAHYIPPIIGTNNGEKLDQAYIENIENKKNVDAYVKSDLDKIDLLSDVFIKNVPDMVLVPPIKKKIRDELHDDELQFFSWVEFSDHSGREFSFWFFPVVSFQNNTTDELINNTLSVIEFGRTVRRLYRNDKRITSFSPGNCYGNQQKNCNTCPNEESVRVTLVSYPKPLSDSDDSEYLDYLCRKNEIITDNLEEESYESATVGGGQTKVICLTVCDNRFEQKLGDTDLLVFQNGEIGNAIYRAWISTGFVKQSYTFVIHKTSKLPLWVGKSTFDPPKDEEVFARACKGVKNMIKQEKLNKTSCALITTNQVDACIRALSGLIKAAKLELPVMVNLSTGTDTYSEIYPNEIKKKVLKVIKERNINFLCFSIVDLFLERTKDLIKYLKDQTGLPIIVGGIHAELYPEESIRIEGVDAICVGEAYTSFVNVLQHWYNRFDMDLPDFWFKNTQGDTKKNRVTNFFNNDDYLKIPIPDYSYSNYYLLDGSELRDLTATPNIGPFKVEQHQIGHEGSIIYSSMGGCSNHCSFCNLTAQVKLRQEMLHECGCNSKVPQFRHKPLATVKEELEQLTEYNKNMKFLCIMENDFTCRKLGDLTKYCELIKRICNVPFYTMLAPNTISEDKLRVMIANGFIELNMGIQTNAEFNKEYYDRHIEDEEILKVVNMVSRVRKESNNKPYPFYDFINFNPEEPDESMKLTVKLVKKFPVPFDFVIHHLTLGDELLLYKRLISEHKVPEKEVMQTTSSDYHNLNVDDYKGWKTLYMNLLLEWIAGSHTDNQAGRIPKNIAELRQTPFGKRLFADDLVQQIEFPDDTDVFDLFTNILYPILNSDIKHSLLKKLNGLLEPVMYNNQKKMK